MVDHEKLGLQRVIALVDFTDEYKPYAEAILTAMNELCYVVLYGKTIPQGLFVVQASVPGGLVDSFKDLFGKLVEKGLFRSVRYYDFDSFRNVPMRAEYYDFSTGRWDFDWSSESSGSFDGAVYSHSEAAEFDNLDLLIIKEFQMDANKSLAEIASKLAINYKVLAWHYSHHVVQRKLIRGYRVNWVGTTYDYKLDKALHRKHRYVIVDILVGNVSENEKLALMTKLDKLPFLWAVAVGKDFYAQINIPIDYMTEALQHIERVLEPVRERMAYYILDQTAGLAFTISYKLFDADAKKWTFDSVGLLSRFDNLLVKVGSKSS